MMLVAATTVPSIQMSMDAAKPATICVAGGGCGSHLCLSKEEAETAMSTCEWTEAYGCYPKFGKCEVQQDGKCGWTDTPELKACIYKANQQ
jgi:hypothetical protein